MIAYPNIDPVAFSWGFLSVRWYGLAYALGFVIFIQLGKYRAKTRQIALTVDEIDELIIKVILGIVIGARLGEVIFYYPNYYFSNPIEIVKVWKGGLSFHGGLLGVIVAVVLFARKYKIPSFLVFDSVAPLAPPGLLLGRIANFINAELIGRPTDVPWGMIFPRSDGLVRHPSQLYQAFFEGLLLFIILWCYSKVKTNINNLQNSDELPHPRNINGAKPLGSISGMFLLCYGVFRFIVEFTRTPDTFMGYYPLGLSMGQFLCLPMIVIGGYLIYTAKNRQEKWENKIQNIKHNKKNSKSKKNK